MSEDRVVVITGAAGVVGALLVERFLANGDTVLATDLSSDALERLRGGTGDDAKLITTAADISKEEDCEGLADLVNPGLTVKRAVRESFPTEILEAQRNGPSGATRSSGT